MTLGLLEACITALNTYLQANMATKLTALNTEYGDSLLVTPKAYYYGAIPTEIPEYPSCGIIGEAWDVEAQREVNLQVKNFVTIVFFVGDADGERRFKKLCRYARACVELLEAGDASYGYEWFLEGPVQLSEVFTGYDPFIQAVGVPCSFHKVEAF